MATWKKALLQLPSRTRIINISELLSQLSKLSCSDVTHLGYTSFVEVFGCCRLTLPGGSLWEGLLQPEKDEAQDDALSVACLACSNWRHSVTASHDSAPVPDDGEADAHRVREDLVPPDLAQGYLAAAHDRHMPLLLQGLKGSWGRGVCVSRLGCQETCRNSKGHACRSTSAPRRCSSCKS